MNTTYTQTLLFPTMDTNKTKVNFQIKRFDDPSFGIELSVEENQDPEVAALEQLGYFIVPETIID